MAVFWDGHHERWHGELELMKRNIVPLFGIAFVVAIISTGVFYGLFAGKLRSSSAEAPGHPIMVAARDLERGSVVQASDIRVSQLRGSLSGSFSGREGLIGATLMLPVKENEPFIQERLASGEHGPANSANAVPEGMRAVSIRVAESEGIVNGLHPGSRIDIQAVSDRNGKSELETILQNVEVLTVMPDGNGASKAGVRVISVLTWPRDADLVALADSAARIRVALRNPLDQAVSTHRPLEAGSLFRSNSDTDTPPKVTDVSKAARNEVQLEVQVLAVSLHALSELAKVLAPGAGGESIHIARFQPGIDADTIIKNLGHSHELDLVSARTITAANGQPASFRAGDGRYRLRMRFSPVVSADGKLSIGLTPQISAPNGHGVETREYDANVPEGATLLVEGLTKEQNGREVVEHVFPGRSWRDRDLVIFVRQQGGHAAPVSADRRSSEVR